MRREEARAADTGPPSSYIWKPSYPSVLQIDESARQVSLHPAQGERPGLKAMRSVFDQLPTLLEHTSVGLPGAHSPSVGSAEHRSAMYSSSVSTNRLDTAQMAMIRYTLTSTSVTLGPVAPNDSLDDAFGAWLLSTSDTRTVAVAVSAGSPWSFTSTRRRWRGASVSSRARVVLISPVYSPTRNGMRALTASGCSSYESHAL
ncbi:hypothetical protein AAY473_024555 [Plecturocebus cupreus]